MYRGIGNDIIIEGRSSSSSGKPSGEVSSEEEGIVANEFCAAKTMKMAEVSTGRQQQGKESPMVGFMSQKRSTLAI